MFWVLMLGDKPIERSTDWPFWAGVEPLHLRSGWFDCTRILAWTREALPLAIKDGPDLLRY